MGAPIIITMSAKIILSKEQLKDLIQRYEADESLKQLAGSFGYSRPVLKRILLNEGVEIRGRSEAEKSKWKELKKDYKKVIRQCGNAWKATTDRKKPDEEKIKMAQSRYKNQSQIHKGECAIAAKLWKAGFKVEQQYPEYVYNLDVAIPSNKIAVEIVGSNWKPDQKQYHHERTKHLLKNGWLVVFVFTWCKEAGLLRHKNTDSTFASSTRILPRFLPEKVAAYILGLKHRIEKGEELHGRYVIISGNGIILSAAYKKAMFFNGLPCLTDSHGHTFGLLAQSYNKLSDFA
jgi:very-short-patch-repair endonuclease